MSTASRRGARGIVLAMGGRDYLVPALTLAQLDDLEPELELLEAWAKAPTVGRIPKETRHAGAKVIAAALGRNYPEMTVEAALGLLDLNNFGDAIGAIVGATFPGREKTDELPAQEGATPGEAKSASA